MSDREELIEEATWALIDNDTDVADRGVSGEHYQERRADVERVFPILTRRTVQGNPGEHGGTIPLYGMLDVWMALYGASHPEFDAFYVEHGYADTWARILAAVRERRTVQGEPSDAQVLAALNASQWVDYEMSGISPAGRDGHQLSDFGSGRVEMMRAALRAAGGVR